MYRYIALAAQVFISPVQAQHAYDSTVPTEAGQSAFAALAEIVEILRQDPHTNWQRVNVPALQLHLVDMEILATEAKARSYVVDGSVRFEVTGGPRVVEALHRMVPAHAPLLDVETGWATEVTAGEQGVTVIVRGETEVISALGFHGLMTIGAHHQEHHLGIATGLLAHH